MDQASKTKLRSTISAIIAALVMFGPDILEALNAIDAAPKWVKLIAKGFGLLLGLATSGKAVAILNKILPDEAPKVPPAAVALLLGFGVFAVSSSARADALVLQLSPSWQCSPVGMLSGFQYNVKTGDFQRGVALGAGYGCRYTGWKVPLGIDAVGGVGVATNSPNAAQGSLIFTVADNYGIGPGTQIFKDPVDGSLHGQMLVSFFLTGSWAATVDQLVTAKHRAVEASQVKDGRVPWPY